MLNQNSEIGTKVLVLIEGIACTSQSLEDSFNGVIILGMDNGVINVKADQAVVSYEEARIVDQDYKIKLLEAFANVAIPDIGSPTISVKKGLDLHD